MRCLFAHEWVTLWEKSLGTIACFRKCKRCGILERGVGSFESRRLGDHERAQFYQGAASPSSPATLAPPRPVGPFIRATSH